MKVGVVPQMDNLDPDFSLRENLLRLWPLLRHGNVRHRRARTPALLEFAGLAGKADAR